MAQVWEERWHPLREEWILFTSHRGGRPWVGDTFAPGTQKIVSYDPTCALCPGNRRIKETNPKYTGVFWFTNDLPCYSDESPATAGADPLYATQRALGTAEVLCYDPDHGKTFADLTVAQAIAVVEAYTDRYRELGARPTVNHVLIFENKGSLVGTSNPHPHCQIYASNLIYGITEREVQSSRRFHEKTKRFLLEAIVEREMNSARVICQNEHFLACVPWFARYAYEVHVYPKQQAASLAALSPSQRQSLGRIMRAVAIRFDNLWRMPFPYVMAVHNAPTDDGDHSTYPFHIEYHPPLRKPDTMKYLAGPEIGGGTMTNESDPDEKAAELRAVSDRLCRA